MRRTKTGLALGAGAAKGWAHIGVICALKRAGIDIDIVAGCSIGALVGAAFACERLDELERWVRAFSYWDVLRLMDFSWQRGGLLRGERVFKQVQTVIPHQRIEACQRPFAAVATNLSTGREIWFTEGDLHLALRASCSMPGLLAPVRYNNYWLVDGAVVNPVPVSLTRAMGADVVIAVDLHNDAHLMPQDVLVTPQPLAEAPSGWRNKLMKHLKTGQSVPKSAPPSAMEVMTTSIQVLENRLKRNRMAGDPPDITLQPHCPQISTLDFHRASEAIEAGIAAVENNMDVLLPLVHHHD